MADEQRLLYDPRRERDACGIGLVADVRGRASRELLDRALAGLAAVGHRGAWAADGVTGDGAGVLLPLTETLTRKARRRARDVLPPRGLAARDGRGRLPGGRSRAERLAQRPHQDGGARRHRARLASTHRTARARSIRAPGRRATRVPRPPEGRARRRRLHRIALVPHGDLQGALRGRPALALLRRPRGSGARGPVRDLPPALLDEHRAELGARAAVPARLPQRRDQHDRRATSSWTEARESALGLEPGPRAGARPLRIGLRAPRQRARAPRPRIGRRASPRPSRCSCRRPGRTTRGSTRRCATSIATARCSDRAVGRPRGALLHGRPRLRRRARPQRAAPASRRRHRATGSSRSPPRRVPCRFPRAPASVARGSGRAGSSPSTPSAACSSTPSSGVTSRAAVRTGEWVRGEHRAPGRRRARRGLPRTRWTPGRCSTATRARTSPRCCGRSRRPATTPSTRWGTTRRSRRSPAGRARSRPTCGSASRR